MSTATDRDEVERLRAELLEARKDLRHARGEYERLADQMRQANEQLVLATVHADEMADRAQASEHAKDDFLAMLGHELRNPLSPIATMLDVMEMQAPALFAAERALIARQVKHMVRLVDDLLDVSRISSGRVELHREPTQLGDVVATAVEMVRPLVEAKQHELVVQVDPGLVVDGDPVRLAQVAGNLMTNAAKYTPSSGRIVVRGERSGADVVLAIADNGIGISEQMVPRVFDMFAQERQALDRAQGGLGLGLAIVKTLVALHGGSVEARSGGRDRGSEFIVRLPSLEIVAPPARRIAALARVAAHGQHRILIVDDNEDSANVTGRLLTEIGHDVRVAYDGPTALAVVKDFSPDIALLDIGLPGMDGYELAHELHARFGDLRMIAVSGYGQAGDRQRSADAGFAMHLVKPVTCAALRDAVA
jgi:signal transduction histidine kinase